MTDLHLYRKFYPRERLYSLLVIWVPLLATIYSVVSGMLFSIHLSTFILFIACYSATTLGITVGFHRLLTHRSFKTTRFVKIILVLLGCMAWEGSPFFWVAAHRRHHKYVETNFDPHSPHSENKTSFKHFYHAHMGWMTNHTLESWRYYIGDLLLNHDLRIINKYYASIALMGLLIPGVINGLIFMDWYHFYEGIMICGFVRICLFQQVSWSINSVCHLWGKLDFQTSDNSRNNRLFALLAFGEGWHNGHHAFPSSAKHGLKKWQLDISYCFIYCLSLIGLAKDIRLPTKEQINQKRLCGDDSIMKSNR